MLSLRLPGSRPALPLAKEGPAKEGLASVPLAAGAIAGGWLLHELSKTYGPTRALDGVTLSIQPGEIVAVTGPSGAGKSTLGRLVSGLEAPSAGQVLVGGHDITARPARMRRVAHMFESFALYPTRTVAQNVASPLEAPGHQGRFAPAERGARIAEVLALTEMEALRDRLPSQLSGGQKQRVALCRALVQDPTLYVLDEPIGHLDARLRHHLRGEIRRRQRRLAQGTLWLTPDGIEAMAVADRLMVLIDGRVQQIGAPEAVYARPANVAVARLIGDPAMNVVPVTLRLGDGADRASGLLTVPGQPPVAVSSVFMARFGVRTKGGRLIIGLRPTELRLLPEPEESTPVDALRGTVWAVEPLGRHTWVTVDIGPQRVRVKTGPHGLGLAGMTVRLAFDPLQTLSFDAETGLLNEPAATP
jgi:ABC-type sugar transport system ATPase subunit